MKLIFETNPEFSLKVQSFKNTELLITFITSITVLISMGNILKKRQYSIKILLLIESENINPFVNIYENWLLLIIIVGLDSWKKNIYKSL